ncbi:hypothetical protein CHU98_g12520 [Xylaria longipes]|nr:hypothetical protein CHU98_g12520 [Xylaria longipes]
MNVWAGTRVTPGRRQGVALKFGHDIKNQDTVYRALGPVGRSSTTPCHYAQSYPRSEDIGRALILRQGTVCYAGAADVHGGYGLAAADDAARPVAALSLTTAAASVDLAVAA